MYNRVKSERSASPLGSARKEEDRMNFDKYTQNAQAAVADCQNIAIENGQQQLEG